MSRVEAPDDESFRRLGYSKDHHPDLLQKVEFEFIDSGPGFSEEDLRFMFQRFYQAIPPALQEKDMPGSVCRSYTNLSKNMVETYGREMSRMAGRLSGCAYKS